MSEPPERPRFVVTPAPYSELLHLLRSGEVAAMTAQAFAGKVSAELRAQGPAAMPGEIATWLADYLDGKVRRGRPAEPGAAGITRYYGLIYRACVDCLNGGADLPGEFISFVLEHNAALHHRLAIHERAAALTSIWCHGHDGHAKKILNRISSRKS